MSQPSRFVWLPQDSVAVRRLFCFPYAGAGASVFAGWNALAGEELDVCPVQLPGRENRLREPAHDRIEPLIDELADSFFELIDIPFAFYGHSMGGLIAFELVRALRKRGMTMPTALFAGACRAPQIANPRPPIVQLADDEFVAELGRRYAGIPESILSQPALMDLFLPTLRADFSLVENYRLRDESPLDCPIVCFGGMQDSGISHEELRGWDGHSQREFVFEWIDGDHFFLKTAGQAILEKIQTFLQNRRAG